ncbi:hypothetical protein VFPPC_16645 [Pochonia chlamydosporia 170]|uniref:Uncharacterized protein n=1 Tax=Pochonia chlamydosporia 170 TaxID=1380566 RepID=A0A179FA47_METCM|nr:hypothetical protein VFPPC_16645 [Pochonia chlamydosporia 170]OAQ62344.1 hypothetical protein VFPPC_16645 [Pochonia chlamydosporia 170]
MRWKEEHRLTPKQCTYTSPHDVCSIRKYICRVPFPRSCTWHQSDPVYGQKYGKLLAKYLRVTQLGKSQAQLLPQPLPVILASSAIVP